MSGPFPPTQASDERRATSDEDAAPLARAERLARLPVVALVGRPNTGKSTLFNRLTRSRRAVVASEPGVTRDRNMAVAEAAGVRFLVVDTGGFDADPGGRSSATPREGGFEATEEIDQAVRAQSLLAAEEADVIIVVLDARTGLNPLDSALVGRLRRLRAPVLVAVNKIDTPSQAHVESEFFALGVDALYPISAEHGPGVGDLVDAVLERLSVAEPAAAPGVAREGATAVAIVGRPNVGKSSLLNRLVGHERSIVSSLPGTTRDPIDTRVMRDGHAYVLVDTAGVRRRPKVASLVERATVVRAFRALEQAEVALLVVDATEGLTDQDARLAAYAWERGRGLGLIVNKWDAVRRKDRDREAVAGRLDEALPILTAVPKMFVSALTGQGVEGVWTAIDAVAAAHHARLATHRLNVTLMRAVEQQAPPMLKGKRPRLFYATQTATAPPTITIFTTNPEAVPVSYERYLVNRLRADFGCIGTPIRLRFRARRENRQGDKRSRKTRGKEKTNRQDGKNAKAGKR